MAKTSAEKTAGTSTMDELVAAQTTPTAKVANDKGTGVETQDAEPAPGKKGAEPSRKDTLYLFLAIEYSNEKPKVKPPSCFAYYYLRRVLIGYPSAGLGQGG